MLITKHIEIDLAHRVPNHKSKCSNLHGHRYKIEVGVDDKIITDKGSSDEGMVIDFGDLKEIMMQEIDGRLDHNAIFWEEDVNRPAYELVEKNQSKLFIYAPFIPTAENIAKYIYDLIEPKLEERNIKIKHVRIWETPTSTATYEKD